ncbi:MAG: TrbC/VirB2 family protein [Desulfobulbaceae bacterium]|nr:TrbC/VirB2 family protein [Desulfobulbaceae bacterium]
MKMDKRILLMTTVVLALAPQVVFAAAGGGGLPWEGPLTTIQISLTGSVAISIALIAIAVAGGMLIFGGEINNFARTGVYITLVLGLLVMANNVLTGLYAAGATIPEELAISTQTTEINKD